MGRSRHGPGRRKRIDPLPHGGCQRSAASQREREFRREEKRRDEDLGEISEEGRAIAFDEVAQKLDDPTENEDDTGEDGGTRGPQSGGRFGRPGEKSESDRKTEPQGDIEAEVRERREHHENAIQGRDTDDGERDDDKGRAREQSVDDEGHTHEVGEAVTPVAVVTAVGGEKFRKDTHGISIRPDVPWPCRGDFPPSPQVRGIVLSSRESYHKGIFP